MNDDLRFKIAPGTLNALAGSGSSSVDKNPVEGIIECTLNGDLSQMGTMGQVLNDAGFPMRHSGAYPVIQGTVEQIKAALKYLWDREIHGWWNQDRAFIEHGICTDEEFTNKLNIACKKQK